MAKNIKDVMKAGTGLDKLLEVKKTKTGLRTIDKKPINLEFMAVANMVLEYPTKYVKPDHPMLRSDPGYFSRTGSAERAEIIGKGIPKNATHYYLGDVVPNQPSEYEFIPVAFFREKLDRT